MNMLQQELRPYQLEAARAIFASVRQRRGLTFSVEIARQGGKNELSSRLELLLLATNLNRDVTAIKVAPTLKPQALISLDRLWQRVQDAGLQWLARKENGNSVRLGRARQVFLSAEPSSNIVGHTADLFLEVDEAQDIDAGKFDKEVRPMAASSGATTVFYGTAWNEDNLLERVRRSNLAAEINDGVRRHFEYDWQVVASSNPAYGAFVEAERLRLGEDHPLFRTQYCLQVLPDQGRLLNASQRLLMQGSHARLTAPVPGEVYVAGLDIGGEAPEPELASRHDATVLTLARLRPPQDDDPLAMSELEVVAFFVWQGTPQAQLYGALRSLLGEVWTVRALVVDATGLGEPLAAFLRRSLHATAVRALKLSAESKSQLGYDLVQAAAGGRLRLFKDEGTPELAECQHQLSLCRAYYRPNRQLSFTVDERDGHDDYVMSLALAVAAANAPVRVARGR